jgi:hypothetical protein
MPLDLTSRCTEQPPALLFAATARWRASDCLLVLAGNRRLSVSFGVRCRRLCTFGEPIGFWKEEDPVRFDHGLHRFARIESRIRRFLSVCIRAIRGRKGLWWHEDKSESTEPAAGANDEERGHVAVPGRASLARSSSWLSSSLCAWTLLDWREL